jgi:phosphatidate phosphatase PAH1
VSQIVISDVDGTITKSDVFGHVRVVCVCLYNDGRMRCMCRYYRR